MSLTPTAWATSTNLPAPSFSHSRLDLIARQAAAFKRRPVLGVANDGAVAAGDFRKVVPVAAVPVERDVAVGQIEVERAVVIQIAELRAETPAAEFDSEIARQIFVLDGVARRSLLRHPQIISLDQDAVFGNIGNVDGVSALVEDVAKGGVHSALGREAHAGLFAHFMKALAVIEIELGNSVVVGDKQIGMPGAAQVRGRRGQRPAPAVDANFLGDFFKLSVAQIVKQIFAPAILGILKTLGHDARGCEMPEINVFGIVAADKQIQQAIAVVVKPDGGVGIDPARQAGLLAYAGEAVALVVVVTAPGVPI